MLVLVCGWPGEWLWAFQRIQWVWNQWSLASSSLFKWNTLLQWQGLMWSPSTPQCSSCSGWLKVCLWHLAVVADPALRWRWLTPPVKGCSFGQLRWTSPEVGPAWNYSWLCAQKCCWSSLYFSHRSWAPSLGSKHTFWLHFPYPSLSADQ